MSKKFIEAFDSFKEQIDTAYAAVREELEQENWDKAQQILASIGMVHAKTSLSLRNVLIKRGLIKADD